MNRRDALGVAALTAFGGLLTACTKLPSADIPLGGPFTDTNGHPYEWAIEKIRLAGLTAGCGNNEFCPDRPITRGEMAVMLARMMDETK